MGLGATCLLEGVSRKLIIHIPMLDLMNGDNYLEKVGLERRKFYHRLVTLQQAKELRQLLI